MSLRHSPRTVEQGRLRDDCGPAVADGPSRAAGRPRGALPPMAPCLGAAVIGLGVGEQHLRGFDHPPYCRMVAICDCSAEKLNEVSGRHPELMATTDWRALLGDERVDIVSIASFDDAHCEQVLAALEAGRHVFVEKPLCRSLAELRQIAAAARVRPRQRLASNLVLRAAPAYRWLRAAIQDGLFGEIYAFDGDYLFGRIEKITQGWRRDIVDYSVMQGGGVHLVDLMIWLTGQVPREVAASGNRIATRGTDFRYHDFVAATFTFASGMVGRITANFGCMQPHQHVVRVFGTQATFVHDDQGPRYFTRRDAGAAPVRLEQSPLPLTKWELIPEFVEAAASQADGWASVQREFQTISACCAADVALRAGTQQQIEYL